MKNTNSSPFGNCEGLLCKMLICVTFHIPTISRADEIAVPFKRSLYEQTASTKAVVLISVNWNRQWKCGTYENAQLQSFSFDKAGTEKEVSAMPDLLLKDDSFISTPSGFVNYAFVVDPGEYLFGGFRLKVAKSVSEVGYFSADRSILLADGKSKVGRFQVEAGEIVYLGHFAVNCTGQPMPWRYYAQPGSDFDKYLNVIKKQFPSIDTQSVKFRPFETSVMGGPIITSK
jgi:hypothetical protein